MSIDKLNPGWNEIARQKDIPLFKPGSIEARTRSYKQKHRREWRETGPISIKEATEMRDAGLLVMAQKRDESKRRLDKRGNPIPFVGPVMPDMVLLVKKTQRAAREMEAAE